MENEAYRMTKSSIDDFLKKLSDEGMSKRYVAIHKNNLNYLMKVPEVFNRSLTKEFLEEWRRNLKEKGTAEATIRNYVKSVNRYLRFMGWDELCFQRGHHYDLRGKSFGYLTALTLTGEKKRKDNLWHCRCKCGRELDVPAVSLISGNTTSCGCLKEEILDHANKNIEGTSIRQTMTNRVRSSRAASGYTGVQRRRNKWQAVIQYKGIVYRLGTYEKIEDAVAARMRAKEAIMEDAAELEKLYDKLHSTEKTPGRKKNRVGEKK